MSIGSVPNQEVHVVDELALLVAKIEDHLRREQYQEAATLFENHSASAWFGFQPTRAVEVMQLLVAQTPAHITILKTIIRLMTVTTTGQFDSNHYLTTINSEDSSQMFLLSMFRMADLSMYGRPA